MRQNLPASAYVAVFDGQRSLSIAFEQFGLAFEMEGEGGIALAVDAGVFPAKTLLADVKQPDRRVGQNAIAQSVFSQAGSM